MPSVDSAKTVKVKLHPNVVALQEFIAMRSSPYFAFCQEICLGHATHARDLFERVIHQGVNQIENFKASEDLWFYKNLHVVLSGFMRFKRDMKPTHDSTILDWRRLASNQLHTALRRLNLDEREIYLHRMLNKFGSDRIAQIVSLESPKVAEIFQSAIIKLV